MTKREIKTAKENVFKQYPQAFYLMTDCTNGETMILDDKMQKIASINLFDYIKQNGGLNNE
jgi:hypothetical protein